MVDFVFAPEGHRFIASKNTLTHARACGVPDIDGGTLRGQREQQGPVRIGDGIQVIRRLGFECSCLPSMQGTRIARAKVHV